MSRLIELLAQRKRAKAEEQIFGTATEKENETESTASEEQRERVFFPSLAFGCVADEFSEYF